MLAYNKLWQQEIFEDLWLSSPVCEEAMAISKFTHVSLLHMF